MIQKTYSTILLCLVLVCSGLAQSSLSTERLDRYDAYFQKEIDEGRLPGVVTLVYKNGEKVHESTLGYSDLTAKTPTRSDQIFYIQSMTKPIITAAFMMLYEEGHFFLNDPLHKYLPEFKDAMVAKDVKLGSVGGLEPVKSPITIAQLMSHTAGFSHGLGSSKVDEEVIRGLYQTQHKDIASRVAAYAKLPLYAQPGTQWYYSASPDILARLIEVFSGQTTAEFLQQRLFNPLGMKDTGYNLSEEQAKRMTVLHSYDDDGKLTKAPRQTTTSGNTVFAGANALFSTAQDYSLFARMMLNGGELNGRRYLSSKTVELMAMNQSKDLFQDPGKGFGFGFAVVDDLADTKSLGSEGTFYWSGAYCTYFFIDPKEDMVAIFMTQVAPFSSYYENKFRQMVYQAIE
ncbi:MAG: serine hydrolase domain-containing protein [Algoriphagus sp.]|uniref:serine hydrolase domain-containing protein n=1 Tax=Algoriphagus sp. TaxID=1872435 RepID=UPI00273007D6|nr:serine hydrolase domain-containing protein [Algoriphagus sp.]MDP2042286.1 serine hydrolase domain-containing protein [Algoriphagus sp.]MDP3474027.1 serine hydrolase domain-containing protein [Algoriphagus sp.]